MSNPDNDICNGLSKLQLESNGENKANMKQFAQKCRELFEQDEDGDIQLHLAIASSHYDVADTLIRLCPQPAFLSTQNRQSYSPLHIAVLQNNPAIVRALIVNGASLASYDRDGNTPLHLAAVRGYLECGEALLKPISVQEMSNRFSQWILANHKPEEVVDRCNYYGEQCVHLAIASSHCDVADTLIRLCPQPAFLSTQNRQSYSPLHIAVLQNNPAIVRALIVNGASLASYDRDGNTPLHLAAVRGYLECGEALLKPISVQEMSNRFSQWILANHKPEEVVDRCNYYGEQCVHLAAMGGHCRFLQFLCWNNADMNAQEGRGGRTPLHFAVGAKSLEAAHCLVEPKPFGCGVNPNLTDWCNKSAIQMAKVNHSSHIVTYLSAHVVVVATGEDDDLTYFSDGFESETESGFDGLMVQSRT